MSRIQDALFTVLLFLGILVVAECVVLIGAITWAAVTGLRP